MRIQERPFLRPKTQRNPPNSTASAAPARDPAWEPTTGHASREDCAAVAIVSVVVAAVVPLGVTVDGLKLHDPPVGNPLHAKLT